jgi:hypothetical protein
MKSTFSIVFIFCTCWKQEIQKTPPNFGQKGNLSLLFNQSAYNKQWLGGTSNMAGNFGINYDFNYKRVL